MTGSRSAFRFIVSGHVQGVFFRASTARRASELGIVGHARNLDDGTVEVLAIGPPDRLRALREWLEVGPPAARVTGVEAEVVDLPAALPGTFSTG